DRKQFEGATPGPWHVYRGGNFTKIAPEGYDELVERTHYLGGAICKLDDWTGEEHRHDAPHVLPTAHLIAAAPELLAENKKLREALQLLLNDPVISGMSARIRDVAHQEGHDNPLRIAWAALNTDAEQKEDSCTSTEQ